MTTVYCQCRVADFDAFRPGYDRAIEITPELRSYGLWRGQSDPNLVLIAETFYSREAAEAVWTSPVTKEAMAADGIDMSSVCIDYMEEVISGTR